MRRCVERPPQRSRQGDSGANHRIVISTGAQFPKHQLTKPLRSAVTEMRDRSNNASSHSAVISSQISGRNVPSIGRKDFPVAYFRRT